MFLSLLIQELEGMLDRSKKSPILLVSPEDSHNQISTGSRLFGSENYLPLLYIVKTMLKPTRCLVIVPNSFPTSFNNFNVISVIFYVMIQEAVSNRKLKYSSYCHLRICYCCRQSQEKQIRLLLIRLIHWFNFFSYTYI
jgi:hypothetical protein